MLKKKCFCLVAFVALVFSTSFSQDEVSINIARLQSGDSLTVQIGQSYILRRCEAWSELTKEFLPGLLAIIQKDDNLPDTVQAHQKASYDFTMIQRRKQKRDEEWILSDAKTSAAFIVGNLRSKDALPALAKHINYVTPGYFHWEVSSNGPQIEDFPCAIAMSLMGDTAIPYLLDIIKKHPDEETRILAAKTIQSIRGSRDIKPFEEALTQSTDSSEQQNIKDIIRKSQHFFRY